MASGNESGTFWMPPQSSTIAGDVDALFEFIYWLNVIFFLMIAVGTVWFAIKYRRRHEGQLATSQVAHNTLLESLWTFIPLVLVLAVFVWGFRVFLDQSVAPENAYEVRVKGEKWSWTFTHPGAAVPKVNILDVPPPGTPTKLVMSATDVLHSFFIPEFRVKADVIPGRYTTLWFEPTRPGTYQVFCTEYCGTGHSDMLAKVVVHPTMESFNKAVTGGGTLPEGMTPVAWGEQLYTELTCNACHSLDGSRKVGPSFKGIWGTQEPLEGGGTALVDENYIRESILDPNAKVTAGYPAAMPTFKGRITDAQIDALIEFIKAQK